MNWLARLKKTGTDPKAEATEPTKPALPALAVHKVPESVGFVGFVAPIPVCIEKTGSDAAAANEPAKTLTNLNSEGTQAPPDPDRWCWPHSSAMNTAEIDTFTARLARFTDKGMNLDDAEKLADKLVMRDRDADDRRLCMECAHLAGQSMGFMRCGNWQAARLAVRASDAQLSTALVMRLQRCDGFGDCGQVNPVVTG